MEAFQIPITQKDDTQTEMRSEANSIRSFWWKVQKIWCAAFVIGNPPLQEELWYLCVHLLGKRSERRKSKKNVESLKVDQKFEKDLNVVNEKIRTSKIEKSNYLWRIAYVYQGLWGVRLGSIRLGKAWLGWVRLGKVRLCSVRSD